MTRRLILLLLLFCGMRIMAQPTDYVWTSASKNSSESMPCGGGSIGMNVWVEDGDILSLAPGKPEIVDSAPIGRLAVDGGRLVPIQGGVMGARRRMRASYPKRKSAFKFHCHAKEKGRRPEGRRPRPYGWVNQVVRSASAATPRRCAARCRRRCGTGPRSRRSGRSR